MAFGFRRETGTGRGYVNVDNPVFAPGHRLSRRQYDKYIEQIGARTHLPGVAAVRDAERRLEAIRDDLARRRASLDADAAILAAREAAVAERELAVTRAGAARRGKQLYGQKQYDLVLDLYVKKKRDAGEKINKREARSRPEFKAIMRDIKGREKQGRERNPNITSRNVVARRRAWRFLGEGGRSSAEYYEMMFGYRPVNSPHGAVVSRTAGARARRVNRG